MNTFSNTLDSVLRNCLRGNGGISANNRVLMVDSCPTRVDHRAMPDMIVRPEPTRDVEHNDTAWRDSCSLTISSIEWRLEHRFRSFPRDEVDPFDFAVLCRTHEGDEREFPRSSSDSKTPSQSHWQTSFCSSLPSSSTFCWASTRKRKLGAVAQRTSRSRASG